MIESKLKNLAKDRGEYSYFNNDDVLKAMVGETFDSVKATDEELIFECSKNNLRVIFHHDQNCCESVEIEDICGDLTDLTSTPILQAEEISHEGSADRNWDTGEVKVDGFWPDDIEPRDSDSYTWTFYKFSTNKGNVTVRWFGSSNGYYSERVDAKVINN